VSYLSNYKIFWTRYAATRPPVTWTSSHKHVLIEIWKSVNRLQNNQDEHTLRSLSTSQVCLSWSFWCSQSDQLGDPFLGHFGGLFEGSKKDWKMTKNRHLDEKFTSPHATKNFRTHKIRHLIDLNRIKINKTQQE
jgi:hypothetical protein